MIVAVVPMGEVQPPINQVASVIPMRHGFVSTARTVHVVRLMSATGRSLGALFRIGLGHVDHMLVDMVSVRMMQMAVMQIVDVVPMSHSCVPTAGTMFMIMLFVMG